MKSRINSKFELSEEVVTISGIKGTISMIKKEATLKGTVITYTVICYGAAFTMFDCTEGHLRKAPTNSIKFIKED